MHLTASGKTKREVCICEKVCAYKKVVLNYPSLNLLATILRLKGVASKSAWMVGGVVTQYRTQRGSFDWCQKPILLMSAGLHSYRISAHMHNMQEHLSVDPL